MIKGCRDHFEIGNKGTNIVLRDGNLSSDQTVRASSSLNILRIDHTHLVRQQVSLLKLITNELPLIDCQGRRHVVPDFT